MLRMIVEWGAKKLKTLRALPFAGALLCIMQCFMRVLSPPPSSHYLNFPLFSESILPRCVREWLVN
jgi:hypothetical protein